VTARDFVSWTGWIESRVVSLLNRIEKAAPRLLPQPWSEQMACPSSGFPIACTYYIGLSLIGGEPARASSPSSSSPTAAAKKVEPGLDFGPAVIEFQQTVCEWKGKTSHMDITVKQCKRDKLTAAVAPFVMPADENEEETTAMPSTTSDKDGPAVSTSSSSSSSNSSSGSKGTVVSGNERAKSPSSRGGTTAAAKKGGAGGGKKEATAAAAGGAKVTIQTSEAVYNRVRWDPSLNASEWCIGYEDRFKVIIPWSIAAIFK
jgi:hypothetical protein